MGNIDITIAGGDYDRTRPIADGRVAVDGCNVTYLKMQPQELFFRAIRYAEFDVTELSISSYMLQVRRGVSPYTAIPVFLSRSFRHSNAFIRTDRGIKSPADLKGKVVGCPEYQLTAAVFGASAIGSASVGDTVTYALANGKQVSVEIIGAQPYGA